MVRKLQNKGIYLVVSKKNSIFAANLLIYG